MGKLQRPASLEYFYNAPLEIILPHCAWRLDRFGRKFRISNAVLQPIFFLPFFMYYYLSSQKKVCNSVWFYKEKTPGLILNLFFSARLGFGLGSARLGMLSSWASCSAWSFFLFKSQILDTNDLDFLIFKPLKVC